MHPFDQPRVCHAIEAQRIRAGEEAELDAVDDSARLTRGEYQAGRCGVDERLPVFRCRGIEKDEVANSIGRPIGGAGDHHAAVTVSHENHVVQVFEVQKLHDVGDVKFEIDLRA